MNDHVMPHNILCQVLNARELPELMIGSSTHEPVLRFSARLIAAGASDDLIEAIVTAVLPESYSGDSLKELPGMIASAREKGFQLESPGKSRVVQIVNALRPTLELFHDPGSKAYMAVPTAGGGKRTFLVNSHAAELYIRDFEYKHTGKAMSRNLVGDVSDMLETIAISDGPTRLVYRRVARIDDKVVIDLGDDGGSVVIVDTDGFSVRRISPASFIRDDGLLPLPLPRPGRTGDTLRNLLSLDQVNWTQLAGFLVNCLRGKGPYMGLIVEGPQGSGKSVLCEILKGIIDPNEATRLRLPDNEVELMLQAQAYLLPVFDNTSGMKAEIADTLCTIATGGSSVKRRLFTNQELSLISAVRPFVMNGIGDFVTRPDLMERVIPIQLQRPSQRLTEAEIFCNFREILPEILGWLYSSVSQALREENDVQVPREMRMADAARWITAAEPALGFERGEFVSAVVQNQDDLFSERINNEPLVIRLRELVARAPFAGLMSKLFANIVSGERVLKRGFPQTPQQLSRMLKRFQPALEKSDINVKFEPRTKAGQTIRVWLEGQDPAAGTSELMPLGNQAY